MSTILPGNTGAEQTRSDFFFKPNVQLLNQALAARQKKYDTTLSGMNKLKAKVDEVNTLGTYDTERHAEKAAEYEQEINRVKGLYSGDLSKAEGEFQNLLTQVGKDFGIHGEMRAFQNRHDAYQKNAKELRERRNKGEITAPQYYALARELNRTDKIGIGTDPKKWNPWSTVNLTNAVDKAKFSEDFIKGYKADFNEKWGQPKYDVTGMLYWEKNGKRVADEREIRGALKLALSNELKKTGELEHEIIYNREVRNQKGTVEHYNNIMSDAQDAVDATQSKIDSLSNLDGKELQEEINTQLTEMGFSPIHVDGTRGPITNQAIAALQKHHNTVLAKRQEELQEVIDGGGDPNAMISYADQDIADKYIENMINKDIEPWVQKASYTEKFHDLKVKGNPVWEWQQKIKMAEREFGYRKAMFDYEWEKSVNKDIITRLDQGVNVPNPHGSNQAEFNTKKEGLRTAGLTGQKGIADMMANALNIQDPTARRDFKKGFIDNVPFDQMLGHSRDRQGNIVVKLKGGKTYTIPNSATIDGSILDKAMSDAASTIQRLDIMDNAMEDAKNNILNSGRFDGDALAYLKNRDNLETSIANAEDAYYQAFLNSDLSKNPWAQLNGKVLTKEQFLTVIKNPGSRGGGIAGEMHRLGIGKEASDRLGELHKYKHDHRVTERSYNDLLDEAIANTGGHFSEVTTDEIFAADGKWEFKAKRKKEMAETLKNPANNDNYVYQYSDANGDLQSGTASDVKAAYGIPDDAQLNIGSIMHSQTGAYYTIPLTFIDSEGNRYKAGYGRLGDDQYNASYASGYLNKANNRVKANIKSVVENGAETGTFTGYDTEGDAIKYTIGRGTNLDNPDVNYKGNENYVTIAGKIYERGPNGTFIKGEERVDPNTGQTVFIPTKTDSKKTYAQQKGIDIMQFNYEVEELEKEIRNDYKIPVKYVQTIDNNGNKGYVRLAEAILRLNQVKDRYPEEELISEVMGYHPDITELDAMQMLGIEKKGTSYKNTKYITPEELQSGNVSIYEK